MSASSTDKDQNQIEEFYNDIKTGVNLIKNKDIIIIMKDFNAKLEKERFQDIISAFEL